MKIIYENCGVKNYLKEDHRLASFWLVLLPTPRGFSVWRFRYQLYFRIGLSTLNVVRFQNYLLCSRTFHTKNGDPARTRLAWRRSALRNTDIKWEIKLINCETWCILRKKITKRHWKRQPTTSKKLRKTKLENDRGFTLGIRENNMWHKQSTRGFCEPC